MQQGYTPSRVQLIIQGSSPYPNKSDFCAQDWSDVQMVASGDGMWVAIVTSDGHLAVVNLTTGKINMCAHVPPEVHDSMDQSSGVCPHTLHDLQSPGHQLVAHLRESE